jgi:hypothetical protein
MNNIKNRIKILAASCCLLAAASCSLDKEPLSEYVIGTASDVDSIQFQTREEIHAKYQDIYRLLNERQESWYLDYLLVNETHADNAYAGTTGAEVVPMETNSVDAANTCLARDWNCYLEDVAVANVIVNNIDKVPDPAFSETERRQWKAEARIFRAMIWFDMVRIWGNIPVVVDELPDITAENIEEVYPLYYPKQTPILDTYAQIISDLEEGAKDAPAVNPSDKSILSRSVAKALLAKVYAEKPVRNYAKVIEYCDAVIADGFTLVNDYADLFGMNDAGNEPRTRASSESILEVNYYSGNGNWVTWMLGRDLVNWDQNFTWAKWITPSRDLINAFLAENDQIRYKQSIVYYACSWSNYYPETNYPFAYKCRSAVSNIIKLRLADLLLLKAEALANMGDPAGAAALVNQIRSRVKLANLPASASASGESMLEAVLHERRLELAFEGHRWFDLVRYGKLQQVMNALNSRDEGRLKQANPFDENSELLPIPQTAIDQNTNLVQNKGY